MPEEKQSGCIPAEDYSQCAHFVNAFKIIGKKWTGLIISTLCDQKPLRFKDLTRSLTGAQTAFWLSACMNWKN